jgi:hypothetical protein
MRCDVLEYGSSVASVDEALKTPREDAGLKVPQPVPVP